MKVSATFFVGFSEGRWEQAGPYLGRGDDINAAAGQAMVSCAVDYADQAVMFMTFASVDRVDETRADNILEKNCG